MRLALKYAVDRQNLLDNILRGTGVLGNDHPISRANRYCATDEEIPQRPYDPDRAKFHLKKAGYDTLAVTIQAADAAFPGAVDTGVLMREHAVAAGIDITVERVPEDGYWNDTWLKSPWCFCFWFGRPTEDMMFSTAYAANAAWNDAHWKHERFNQLLVEARAMLDESKRREMYVEMQRIVHNEGGTLVPIFASDLMATTDRLRHGPLATNIQMDGLRCRSAGGSPEAVRFARPAGTPGRNRPHRLAPRPYTAGARSLQAKGVSSRKRRNTFSVMRDTLLSPLR